MTQNDSIKKKQQKRRPGVSVWLALWQEVERENLWVVKLGAGEGGDVT
tara:strand:- start:161 stop:304 length:144 start_codon:yes stop_codon:yes gene_type:complete